ncbi:MFS transporter [Agromyces sp. G08B096]|uniref:MFS transporter n=1 Tax=Agromyces sp. G08B096 TaxID=3156399 RepID=A0AAU7W4B6_9MICO
MSGPVEEETSVAGPALGQTADAPRRRTPLIALFVAQFFSLGGNAIALVAIPIIALQQTGSPLAAGVAGVFATVPLVIGGAFGGVLVDRFGYRTSSIVADVASAATVLAVPVLHATVGLPFGVLLGLVFLGGLLDPPGDTAKTVIMPRLAELARTPLARAAGAQSAVQRTASMVGAGSAGALIALAGPMPALLVDCAGFVLSALLVLGLVPRRIAATAVDPDADPAGAVPGGFVAGIRFIARSPLLRAIVLLVTLTNAIDAAGMTVLKPVYATQVLGDPALLGFMVGCFAAGALTGSAVFGAIGHRWSGRIMFATCFVLAGAPPYTAMALGAEPPVLLPVLVLSGLAAGAINPMIATAMYGLVPDGVKARVFGAMTAGVTATMPLGAFAGGLAVQQIGITATLAICAGLYVVIAGSPLVLRSFAGLSDARTGAGESNGSADPGAEVDAGGGTAAAAG